MACFAAVLYYISNAGKADLRPVHITWPDVGLHRARTSGTKLRGVCTGIKW